jgi:hypothetical protein
MFSQGNKILLVSSIVALLLLWVLLWAEHVTDDFWSVGLPIQVGGLVIRNWSTFWIFITGMSILTILRATLKHTVERDVVSARAQKDVERMTYQKLTWWVVWDVYENFMDTSMVLIAVLRFDIWFILFFVHVTTVFLLHWMKIHQGRVQRFYT